MTWGKVSIYRDDILCEYIMIYFNDISRYTVYTHMIYSIIYII